MATYIFNGECPSGMKQVFIDAYGPQPNDKLRLVVETTSDYKKSGIYSAERDDTSKPVVIDWGDGTVEQVNGDISQKVHEYATVGAFNVVIENIKSYAASTSNSTWYNTTSQNRYTLKEVVAIPDSVTSIGSSAFRYCSGLTSVTIPDGVTSIGSYAFSGCSGLTSVTIPDSVTIIGYTAFDGTPFYNNKPDGLVVLGSVVYKMKGNCPASVTIPSGVTSIGEQAFAGCSGLVSVTIPDSVTSIGNYAFDSCSALTSVTIGNGVTSIGAYAFASCNASLFDTTTIPGVKLVDGWVVNYNNPPTSLNLTGSRGISDNAFSQCNNVISVIIPDTVIGIGYQSFWYFNNLKNITFYGRTISQVQSMTTYDFGIQQKDIEYSGSQVTVTCSDGSFIITASCILKGTDILLADGTTKKVEDLTYDDVLKVWDFDEGQLGSAKVCWLTRPRLKNNHYYQLTFNDGTVLKTTGVNSNHRIFSVDQSKFTNVCDAKVGDKVYSINGVLTITDVKYVEEECEYYNVMTSGKINCFANGILTSDRYGNLYPIENMKYVKDGRAVRPYSEYEAVGINKYWYDNLRLGENTETVEKSKEYIMKCEGQMLPLPETKN